MLDVSYPFLFRNPDLRSNARRRTPASAPSAPRKESCLWSRLDVKRLALR